MFSTGELREIIREYTVENAVVKGTLLSLSFPLRDNPDGFLKFFSDLEVQPDELIKILPTNVASDIVTAADQGHLYTMLCKAVLMFSISNNIFRFEDIKAHFARLSLITDIPYWLSAKYNSTHIISKAFNIANAHNGRNF